MEARARGGQAPRRGVWARAHMGGARLLSVTPLGERVRARL